MGRRKIGRPLNGIMVIDKPIGLTSNAALQQAKRLFFAQKAGHTGSLDPLASGVLPLCFGEATKFSQILLDSDKRYLATVRFGATTSTADAEGDFLSNVDTSQIDEERVKQAMLNYKGAIEQLPPMYSALKHQGKPLHEYARRGEEVERKPRKVTIHEFQLLDFRPGPKAEADVEVFCSKGTYIRTLAEDLGKDLSVGAYISALRRTAAGPFVEEQAIALADLQEERGDGLAEVLDHHLLAVDAALQHLPSVELDTSAAHFFQQGQAVIVSGLYRFAEENDIVRVLQEVPQSIEVSGMDESLSSRSRFLGIGEVTDDGRVTPRRLVV